jgi:hypothetical protein
MTALCLIVAILVGVAAGIGVFMRGEGETRTITSPRGEEYEMVTEGIYRYNSERLVAEGIGWDIVTLFIAVPVVLATLRGLARGSLRARLVSIGMLAYFFYQYLMYAVTWAFGPLFLLFIVIYAASMGAIVWLLSAIDIASLAERFSDRFPRRGIAIFALAMALLLVGMWLGRIVPALRGEIQGVLVGQTTMVVQALDLGIVVPLAVFTAVLAWNRRPIGYLLATIFVVKGAAMAAAITAMVVSAWIVEGAPEIPPLILFAAATAVSLGLGVRIYRSAAT